MIFKSFGSSNPPMLLVGPAIMKKHSFATYQILRRIRGFEEVALWAAQHLESLNGSGYPFHLKAREIPLESRIIRVADVFQAQAQRRPYRGPMAMPDILAILRKMQADNEVDGTIVDTVALHLDECRTAALMAAPRMSRSLRSATLPRAGIGPWSMQRRPHQCVESLFMRRTHAALGALPASGSIQ